jgi:diacylglycerol kinase family enzyme
MPTPSAATPPASPPGELLAGAPAVAEQTEDMAPYLRRESRRMLIIVNPYAATVSDRLRNLVVYALEGRYEVDAVDTQGRGHAIELCREAAHEGYDVVVAFGGDGTVNEVANGLAGSSTPLTCLPGGSTNVYCRLLGIPREIVDATEHVLRMADDWRPRRVAMGSANGRYFTFSAGMGLDASVVERVDRHMRLKARLGAYYFTYVALTTFARRYLLHPPRLVLEPGERDSGGDVAGVSAVIQNASPFTYFRDRRIDIAEGAELHGSTLSAGVLKRASPVDMPTLLWRIFSQTARVPRHRQIEAFDGLERVRIRSADGRPLPLQVDGDYIGELDEAEFGVRPDALTVVS